MIATTGTTSTSAAWTSRREDKERRLRRVANCAEGRVLHTERIVEALEALLEPGDRVALEGDNQKQADFLSRALAQVDPTRVHDLHMLISSISRPEQIDIFEKRIARRIDFAYAGPQSLRVAQLLEDGLLEVGAIHTYVELYARMFVDLPIAGVSPIGLPDLRRTEDLRRKSLIAFPEDLGIRPTDATRSLLAARTIEDLVTWSGGLYRPPAQFRSW